MIRVTRRYHLAASHRLHSDQLSEAENDEIYGKCNNPYGHGHDYVIEVTVRGPVQDETGIAVRLDALDELVREQVTDPMDHRDLNTDIEEFSHLVPTTENLAYVVEKRLKDHWPERFAGTWPRLDRVRIYETGRNIFEVASEGNKV